MTTKRANRISQFLEGFYKYPRVEPGSKAVTRNGRIVTRGELDELTEKTRGIRIPDDTPLHIPFRENLGKIEAGARALAQNGRILDKDQLMSFVKQLRVREWARDLINKLQDAKGFLPHLNKESSANPVRHRYYRGFAVKCAEYGMDFNTLVKLAAKKMPIEQFVALFSNPKRLKKLKLTSGYDNELINSPRRYVEAIRNFRNADARDNRNFASWLEKSRFIPFKKRIATGLRESANLSESRADRLASGLVNVSETPSEEVAYNLRNLYALAQLRESLSKIPKGHTKSKSGLSADDMLRGVTGLPGTRRSWNRISSQGLSPEVSEALRISHPELFVKLPSKPVSSGKFKARLDWGDSATSGNAPSDFGPIGRAGDFEVEPDILNPGTVRKPAPQPEHLSLGRAGEFEAEPDASSAKTIKITRPK